MIIDTIDEGNASLLEQNSQTLVPLFQAILTELRVISTVLAQGLNFPDDLDTLRNDPTYLS